MVQDLSMTQYLNQTLTCAAGCALHHHYMRSKETCQQGKQLGKIRHLARCVTQCIHTRRERCCCQGKHGD